MILNQVEIKEWLKSRSSCAKVNLWSGLDPKQPVKTDSNRPEADSRANLKCCLDVAWPQLDALHLGAQAHHHDQRLRPYHSL